MRPQIIKSILLILLISFLVIGCSGNGSNDGDQAVVTAESNEIPQAPGPATAICDSLTPSFSGAFQAEMSTDSAPFQDVVSGQAIAGCLSTLSTPSETFTSFEVATSLSNSIMQANDWQEDINYRADGPGGVMQGYLHDDAVCMVTTEFGPVDDALCSSDEPFAVCMDRLTADQIIITVTLNCANVP